MKFVVFGLSVSSSWGNGHAVLWRGLIAALLRAGHQVTFLERDVPYYAEHRDLDHLPPPGELVLYPDWERVQSRAQREVRECDVAIVTSYCPDARPAAALLEGAPPLACFYDLDTPVTLASLVEGRTPSYLPEHGLAGFDLVLSYAGGPALASLRRLLGARRVAPLYGWVDPEHYRPAPPQPQYRSALSYLGTYADDRQAALERLLVEPARRRPQARFVIGGAQYPAGFPWAENIFFVRHLPPDAHPAFYAASRLTLNVTRAAMADAGWCPSGRLFEAAACGAPLLSDRWPGLGDFFEPGREILVADTTEDALAAIDLPEAALRAVAARARERVLAQHTAAHRAAELVGLLEQSASPVEA